tara:strand:+ start:33467 stop:33685 length:219 start_codon:yes stop_codon:yes gene_type:complete
METVTIPKAKLDLVISDVEKLLTHFEELVDSQNLIVRERLNDIKKGKVVGKSEEELDEYLKKRGVQVDELDH